MKYLVDEQEEENSKLQERLIIEEATLLVLQGETRSDALSSARQLADERAQAICDGEFVEDENGHPESFIDLPNQQYIDRKDKQHLAIYHELCEQEGISPE